jgi:glycosyltransferase involved in cell wall biosynthesis
MNNFRYTENYENNKKVIVTMTTIPERIEKKTIKKTLDSLVNQTIKPKVIYINVPKKSKKNIDYPIDKLHEITSNYSTVKVNLIEDDLGPITKIIPTLEFINKDDYVILVDDDVQYKPVMIEQLVNSNKDAAGYAGRLNQVYKSSEYYSGPVDFLETYAGVVYKGHVLLGLNDYYKEVKEFCEKQDDIVIGKYLKNKGITPHVISSKDFATHDAEGTPELNTNNLVGGNYSCYDKIWKK